MSNLLNLKGVKVFAIIVLAVAMLFSFGMIATTASAQQAIVTVADIQYAATVQLGSSGQASLIWQRFLNGYSVTANLVEDGKFGPLTAAQAKAWQASRGLVADGVLGPLSRAAAMAQIAAGVPASAFPAGCTAWTGYSTVTGLACTAPAPSGLPAGCSTTAGYSPTTGVRCDSGVSLPAGCSSTSGFSPTTGMSCSGGSSPSTPSGPLMGGAGSITVDDSSEFSSEEVGEGEEDVEVLQFSVEADDESDVEITSIKVEFVESGATSSEDLDDYAESVSVWFKGDKVGEADVDDFSESSDVWTKTISLDGAIVRAGDEEDFVIAVTALNNIDTDDHNSDLWTVDVLNVRFEDAEGVVTTEDTDADALEKTFDFADFASSTDLELKLSLSNDDDINDAHAINVHATNDTDGVEILSFELEAEGDSDIWIDEIPVEFTVTGGDLDDMVSTVYLFADGDKIGTESVTGGVDADETITFDDLDFTIDAGDTVVFTVEVDLKSIADGIAAGDTIQAQITATERALIEAEDESGNDVATGDMTGTAVGDAHAMYDVGIMVSLVSITEVKSGDGSVDDTGTFTMKFKVTAFDDDIYVDGTLLASATATANNTNYWVTEEDGTVSENTVLATLTSTATSTANSTFEVREDQTETFTLTVAVTADVSDEFVKLNLISVGWDTTPIAATTQIYNFNLDDFESDPLYLNNV